VKFVSYDSITLKLTSHAYACSSEFFRAEQQCDHREKSLKEAYRYTTALGVKPHQYLIRNWESTVEEGQHSGVVHGVKRRTEVEQHKSDHVTLVYGTDECHCELRWLTSWSGVELVWPFCICVIHKLSKATARSTKRKVKLECGSKSLEFRSSGAREGNCIRQAVTMSCFCESGSTLDHNNALQIPFVSRRRQTKTVVTCAICCMHATNCMQLYNARRLSGAKTIACNLLTNCMQKIACNWFRIWAGLSLSISVWLVTSYPKCRLTTSYCYYHVILPNAVIGCNTLASWIFSNTFESL